MYIYEVKIQCHQTQHLWLHMQPVGLNTVELIYCLEYGKH